MDLDNFILYISCFVYISPDRVLEWVQEGAWRISRHRILKIHSSMTCDTAIREEIENDAVFQYRRFVQTGGTLYGKTR